MAYSRGVFVHVPNKLPLFKRIFEWVKPGGVFFFTDFARWEKELSPGFQAFLERREYCVETIPHKVRLLEEAGFVDVVGEDWTMQFFAPALDKQVKEIESQKEEYLKEFSEADFDEMVNNWKTRVERFIRREQLSAWFCAKKPL